MPKNISREILHRAELIEPVRERRKPEQKILKRCEYIICRKEMLAYRNTRFCPECYRRLQAERARTRRFGSETP